MSKRNSCHLMHYLLSCIALPMLLTGCSDRDEYQSYRDTGMSQKVNNHVVWSSNLPFKSSAKLAIEVVEDEELLISDPGRGYQLIKIDRSSGLSQKKYLRLKSGSQHSWYGDRLLVSSAKNGRTVFHMVDYENLERKYTSIIRHKKQGDFSIPGQRLSDNTLVLFYSDFEIKRYSHTDYIAQMKYTIPYLKSNKFSFYLLSVDSGRVRKFEDIQDNRLGDLKGICTKSFTAAKRQAEMPKHERMFEDISGSDVERLLKNLPDQQQSELTRLLSFKRKYRKYNLQDYLYYIEKVFLVNDTKTLVFVLANHIEDRHFYMMDLSKGIPSIEECSATELAVLYDELTVRFEERQDEEEAKSKGYIKISGLEYKVDDVAFFRDAVIFAARTRADEKREPAGRWARLRKRAFPSNIICVDFDMERKWHHRFKMHHRIGGLIKDYSGNKIYFPCLSKENKYVLVGLNVNDGSQTDNLPANFRIKTINNKSYLFPTGMHYDFDNGKLYIHDIKKNTIICSTFDH